MFVIRVGVERIAKKLSVQMIVTGMDYVWVMMNVIARKDGPDPIAAPRAARLVIQSL